MSGNNVETEIFHPQLQHKLVIYLFQGVGTTNPSTPFNNNNNHNRQTIINLGGKWNEQNNDKSVMCESFLAGK